MENASAAFLDAVRKSMRQIRSALGAAFIDPTLLTAAERIQYEGYLRREEANAAILARAENGAPIEEIAVTRGRAEASFDRFCVVGGRTCSRQGKVHRSRISRGSTRNGPPGVATAPNFGGASAPRAFVDPCVSCPNGLAAAGARK